MDSESDGNTDSDLHEDLSHDKAKSHQPVIPLFSFDEGNRIMQKDVTQIHDLVMRVHQQYRKSESQLDLAPRLKRGKKNTAGWFLEEEIAKYIHAHLPSDVTTFLDFAIRSGYSARSMRPDLVCVRDGDVVFVCEIKTELKRSDLSRLRDYRAMLNIGEVAVDGTKYKVAAATVYCIILSEHYSTPELKELKRQDEFIVLVNKPSYHPNELESIDLAGGGYHEQLSMNDENLQQWSKFAALLDKLRRGMK